MVFQVGLAYIWMVGIRDVVLSDRLVGMMGLPSEQNAIARWVLQLTGMESFLLYKLATLGGFTLAVLLVRARSKKMAKNVVVLGMFIYSGLALWWDLATW